MTNGGSNSSIGKSNNNAGNLNITFGGTFKYLGSGDATDRLFNFTGGTNTIDSSGSGALHFTNTGTYGTGNNNSTLTLTGTNTGNNTLAGTITNYSSGNKTAVTAQTKNGPGTWILIGSNTYTGSTTITAGTLQIGNGGPTGSLSPASAITNNGTLVFNRMGSATQGIDFAPAIAGTGTLTQAGSGTLVLNGNNTYSGPTSVISGTLALLGGRLNSAVTVNSGANVELLLGSTAVSSKPLTFGANATITIAGTPTSDNYTLITASSISGSPELSGPIADYELKVVGNALNLIRRCKQIKVAT